MRVSMYTDRFILIRKKFLSLCHILICKKTGRSIWYRFETAVAGRRAFFILFTALPEQVKLVKITSEDTGITPVLCLHNVNNSTYRQTILTIHKQSYYFTEEC